MSSRESSHGEKKRTVPKFTSFKPKPAEPDPQPKSDRDEKTSSQRSRHRDRRQDHEHLVEHERDKERPRQDVPRADHKVTTQAAPKSSNDVWFIDKRGDPLILRYGSNDRGKVPSYYRFGAGKLLGSPSPFSLHRDGAREEFTIRNYSREGASVFRDRNAMLAAASRWQKAKRIRPSSDAGALPTASDDFISLEPPRKRRREDHGPTSVPEYRSIYRKLEEAEPDSDDSSESGEEHAAPEMSSSKKRSIELSRQVRDSPAEIPAWLELIGLQDVLFRENQGGNSSPAGQLTTVDEARGLAGLKLSLYEEALPHASQSKDQEELFKGLMREGSRVWDAKTLSKRWDEVSKSHKDSFTLWVARLNFELSKVATCNYEDLKGFLTDKLRYLSEALRKACLSGQGEANQLGVLCDQLAYVVLRLTRFLHNTGYAELGVAVWQAILELAFCRPARFLIADDGFESSFSHFWESEVPRIGEDGAKGWSSFADANDAPEPPEPKASQSGEAPQTRDVFKAWAITERQTTARSRMPARTLDEGSEDDPYRVVMFSDIKDFMVLVPATAIPQVGPRLVDAFLLFCGFPTAGLSSGLVQAAQHDPFVAGRSKAFEAAITGKAAPAAGDQTTRAPDFQQQGGSMALCQDVLFPGDNWFHYINRRSGGDRSEEDLVDVSWVIGTLRYLVHQCGLEGLAEYYLAMEWLSDPKGARKVAKGLLKQFSSNIKLYSAYARIEWVNGNLDVSEKVMSAATSQGLSSASTDGQLLWNTWSWIHLESGHKQAALSRLCSSVDNTLGDSSPSPALLLKAKSHFSTTRDYALSSRQLEKAIQFAESLALLEYLAADELSGLASESQGNISASLASIHKFFEELTSHNLAFSPFHDRILQTAAHLLYYHATHGPYKPSTLRTHLQRLTTLSPQNTILLTLWTWSSSSSPSSLLNDPLRTHLHNLPTPSLSTHLLSISHEFKFGSIHSTRAAFESALNSDACSGYYLLWISYLRFCHAQKELRRRAKEVFYRAIAACPLVKEVYMQAFGTLLVGDFGSADLRGVYGTMVGKGVRVRVDLEVWEGRWKGK
ncbi:NRDE-2, necessary for RNA interference-domain-containing protein [Echria macrotheca]|uniref:NRDE-2, necessary for RNA interference-domain-containing protein n=1 Tax=Echria macrotheca TaxID=438768 RepID=A0AAJ0F721_9PEZI|nr:NRDE-2, necessary for RNA interference-domain-containing protein [Echria macrotheca]